MLTICQQCFSSCDCWQLNGSDNVKTLQAMHHDQGHGLEDYIRLQFLTCTAVRNELMDAFFFTIIAGWDDLTNPTDWLPASHGLQCRLPHHVSPALPWRSRDTMACCHRMWTVCGPKICYNVSDRWYRLTPIDIVRAHHTRHCTLRSRDWLTTLYNVAYASVHNTYNSSSCIKYKYIGNTKTGPLSCLYALKHLNHLETSKMDISPQQFDRSAWNLTQWSIHWPKNRISIQQLNIAKSAPAMRPFVKILWPLIDKYFKSWTRRKPT